MSKADELQRQANCAEIPNQSTALNLQGMHFCDSDHSNLPYRIFDISVAAFKAWFPTKISVPNATIEGTIFLPKIIKSSQNYDTFIPSSW